MRQFFSGGVEYLEEVPTSPFVQYIKPEIVFGRHTDRTIRPCPGVFTVGGVAARVFHGGRK